MSGEVAERKSVVAVETARQASHEHQALRRWDSRELVQKIEVFWRVTSRSLPAFSSRVSPNSACLMKEQLTPSPLRESPHHSVP